MSENPSPQSAEFLELVYKNAAVGLCYVDTQLRYQHINEWLAALNGLPVEAHLGRTVREVLPDVAAGIEPQLRQVIDTGEPIIGGSTEAETPAQPGALRTFSHDFHPVKAEDGTVVGVSCFVQDVSERMKAEDALLRWARIFENTGVSLVISKPDGTIEMLNPAACRMYQASTDTLTHLRDIYATEVHGQLQALSREVNKEGHISFESKHRRRDGDVFPVQVSVTYVSGGEWPDYRIATVEDISERKKAEERSTVAQWVLEGVADGVIVVDHRGDIQSFNPAAEAIFGYCLDEVAGRNVGILLPDPQRSEHDRFIANFMDTGQEKILGIGREVQGQRKDGNTFPMDLRVSELRLDGALMFAAVVRDTTERNQLMSRLVQAQKLDSVGQLAGGIAHDFNNQLGMMLLGVDTILASQTNDSEAPPGLRADLLDIRKGLLHSSALTKKLLLFSQKAPRRMEPLIVNVQIEDTGRMLSRLLGEHIRSVIDLEEHLWNISGDAASIDQIVTNLAINSRDAMPDGGVLAIETRNALLDREVGQTNPRARPGRFVRITVKDTGCGMDEVIRARMYDPFFTTKNPDQNTGLGLSVVYGAVKAHGGWIDVESVPGRGARFDVYLPALADEPVAQSVADLSPLPAEGGSENILLLEDESRLRDRIQKVLEGKGYTVEAYGDLATARPAVSETAFDLILSDLRLPDGKGTELVAEALERDESMGTILMSGYAPTSDASELAKLTKTSFLAKPFTSSELLREVRTQLDRRR